MIIIKSIWLRRIHKWVGLVIGLQFLVWAVSGTAMALLDMDEVAGGEMAEQGAAPLPATGTAWPLIQSALAGETVTNIRIRQLPDGAAIAIREDLLGPARDRPRDPSQTAAQEHVGVARVDHHRPTRGSSPGCRRRVSLHRR